MQTLASALSPNSTKMTMNTLEGRIGEKKLSIKLWKLENRWRSSDKLSRLEKAGS